MMKKYIFLAAATLLFAVTSCSVDSLDTTPGNQTPPEQIFSSADAAQVAVNGIYRAMYMNGWSEGWASEEPGVMGSLLFKDLQGEDHLMANQGSGWFYFDYGFMTDADFTTKSGRQFSQWNLYYTLVAQTNFVIAQTDRLISFGEQGKNVLAQAYALRGYAYFWLYNIFCQGNYAKNSEAPGVPIYTEPTTINSKGVGRGTVKELFERINEDYSLAVRYFDEAGIDQMDVTNIDKHVAYGLWARTALAQEDWANAYKYATEALKKPGLKRVGDVKADLKQFNDCQMPSAMWGFKVIADQTGPFGPFISHMDLKGNYGSRAPQCIDAWLWKNISDTDSRKTAWWDDADEDKAKIFPYGQLKFQYANHTTSLFDIIYLRAEELILIAAEAATRQNDFTAARTLMAELLQARDSNFDALLAARTDANTYSLDTRAERTTLLEEILFQRRVELWCEGLGRPYDLCRLDQGYTRTYEGSNHTLRRELKPNDNLFVSLIPQKEFDSNSALTVADQNPRD